MHARTVLVLTSLAGLAIATPAPLQGYDLSHPPELPHDKHMGVANRRSTEDSVPARKRRTAASSKRNVILTKRAFVCPQTDGEASALITSESSDAQGVCVYQIARICTYFPENGTFSSGSSNCPKSMVAGNASPGSAGGITGGDTTTDTGGETLAPTSSTVTQTVPATQTDISTIVAPSSTTTSAPSTSPTSISPVTPTTTGSATQSASAKPSNAAVPGMRIGMSGLSVVGALSVLVGVLGAGILF